AVLLKPLREFYVQDLTVAGSSKTHGRINLNADEPLLLNCLFYDRKPRFRVIKIPPRIEADETVHREFCGVLHKGNEGHQVGLVGRRSRMIGLVAKPVVKIKNRRREYAQPVAGIAK